MIREMLFLLNIREDLSPAHLRKLLPTLGNTDFGDFTDVTLVPAKGDDA